jgi:RNA polymerase sigma-70 factor (sigma-E family)
MSRRGDEAQFAEYFTARHPAVRRTAYLMCGDWAWADDLAQSAFVRLAASWHRVRDRGALDAFVRTCLVRAFLADARRTWRRRERAVAEIVDTDGGDDNAETVSRALEVKQALSRLAPRQRAVLVLRYYEDLSVAAAAEVLSCTEGTVKSQTARALAALRDVLAAQYSAAAVGELP